MSFSDNIEYLMAHPGTVAVLVFADNDAFSGVLSWRNVLNGALSMLDDQQCAVVYPTGHPVAKVMRRMLRKAAGPKRTMRKVKADA